MNRNFREDLRKKIPKELHSHLVYSYDVVGDVAIIVIRDELEKYESLIGQTLLMSHPHLSVVAKRSGIHSGEFRILPLKVIAGENRTETEVKESGVRLQLDISSTYFSVRSGGERLRVARLVKKDERVLVPFSGIGPYSFVIAKHSEARQVLGVEKNVHAHQWALKNLNCNKRLKNVSFERNDFYRWLEGNNSMWDRIIMPLPKAGMPFVEPALHALNENGWLHFYDMRAVDDFDEAVEALRLKIEACGRTLVSSQVFSCGHCSPRTFRICIDAQVGS